MATPCVLIGSCGGLPPLEIVENVIAPLEVSSPVSCIESIQAYPWHVDTKYYEADINLCTTDSRTIGDEQFADSVQGCILTFNSQETNSFEQVKSWLPFLKEIGPEIRILVCDRCTQEHAVPRMTVLSWCLDNDFELVEINPETDDEDDDEDDFKETNGIPRIIQALKAHTWPRLVMKDNPNIRSPYFQQLMREHAEENKMGDAGNTPFGAGTTSDISCTASAQQAEISPAKQETSLSSSTHVTSERKEEPSHLSDSLLKTDDMKLFEVAGQEDPGGEPFEALFERLHVMKEEAEKLPPEQRKKYAEKVAISFWRAIGGADDELEGLSDSSPE